MLINQTPLLYVLVIHTLSCIVKAYRLDPERWSESRKKLSASYDNRVDQSSGAGFVGFDHVKFIDPTKPIILDEGLHWSDKNYRHDEHRTKQFYWYDDRIEVCAEDESQNHLMRVCFQKKSESYYLGELIWLSYEVDCQGHCTIVPEFSQYVPWFTTPHTSLLNIQTWMSIIKPRIKPPFSMSNYGITPTNLEITSHCHEPRAMWFKPLYWAVSGIVRESNFTGHLGSNKGYQMEILFPIILPGDTLDGIYGLERRYRDD